MFSEKEVVFIIGSPRSGSTWLQIMLAAHPLVCTTVELTLYSKYTSKWIKAWNTEVALNEEYEWSQGLPFLWTEEEFYAFLREFLARVYEKVIEKNPRATHVLDKHPNYSNYVKDMNRLVPHARFIHLLRDGRDVAASIMGAQHTMWHEGSTIDEAALIWKNFVTTARDAKNYQDRYIEVRYEDLLSSGEDTLKAVFQFCDLPYTDDQVKEIIHTHIFEKMKVERPDADSKARRAKDHYRKGKSGTWKEEMSYRQRYIFHRVAGDLLCELGYAEDSWWIERSYQRFTLPVLSVAFHLSKVRKKVIYVAHAILGPVWFKRIKSILNRRRHEGEVK